LTSSSSPKTITFTWSHPRGVAGYTEAQASVALLSATSDITRQQLIVSLAKEGRGVTLRIGPKGYQAVTLDQFPVWYRVQLVRNWSVSFGGQPTPPDKELTQFMINITAPWNESSQSYGTPWQMYLIMQQLRDESRGEVVVACSQGPTEESQNAVNSFVPQSAAWPKTVVEATRPKELKALLIFGRDSN
jgi:hypothetical protein